MLDWNNNDWDFPVERQPVYNQTGDEIPGHISVTNSLTGESMGIHSERYKIVPHADVVQAVTDAIAEADITNDFEVKTIAADGGRRLRCEVLFPDLTVEPKVGDHVAFRISGFNSYDGSWALETLADAMRLVCTNGMKRADHLSASRMKHTANINLEGIRRKITAGYQTFMEEPEIWRRWMGVRWDTPAVESFFADTLAKTYTRQVNGKKTNNKRMEEMLKLWADEASQLGPNQWALYNAMTYWSSHTDGNEITRRNRETEVAKAMRSTRFITA